MSLSRLPRFSAWNRSLYRCMSGDWPGSPQSVSVHEYQFLPIPITFRLLGCYDNNKRNLLQFWIPVTPTGSWAALFSPLCKFHLGFSSRSKLAFSTFLQMPYYPDFHMYFCTSWVTRVQYGTLFTHDKVHPKRLYRSHVGVKSSFFQSDQRPCFCIQSAVLFIAWRLLYPTIYMVIVLFSISSNLSWLFLLPLHYFPTS